MIKISENMLEGFVAEAQRQGIPQEQIPHLLKVAGWLQAHQANPTAFEQGMTEVMSKQAGPAAAVGKAVRGAGRKVVPKAVGKPTPKPVPKPAPKPVPKPAPKARVPAGAAKAPAVAAAVPAAGAPAQAGFRGVVPVLGDLGRGALSGLRYLAFGGAKPTLAQGVQAARGAGSGSGLKTLGAFGAGGAALYGGTKGLEALEGATADQKMLDDIVNYRNQYADFVTKQTMLGALPGLRAQPRLGGGWSQFQ